MFAEAREALHKTYAHKRDHDFMFDQPSIVAYALVSIAFKRKSLAHLHTQSRANEPVPCTFSNQLANTKSLALQI